MPTLISEGASQGFILICGSPLERVQRSSQLSRERADPLDELVGLVRVERPARLVTPQEYLEHHQELDQRATGEGPPVRRSYARCDVSHSREVLLVPEVKI